ncbi:MAG: GNAT family N-acetyltransferase [Candidatus Limnocylindria bacterium]
MATASRAQLAPPPGYSVRRPTMDDVDAVLAVVVATELMEHGEIDFSRDELLGEWERSDLETDGWVVLDGGGRIVGHGQITVRGGAYLDSWVVTHPDHRARGIASHLLDLVEDRCNELLAEASDGARVVIGNFASAVNTEARALLERRGYVDARHFWRMSVEISEEPRVPEWPAGISVRTFEPPDARPVYEAVDEAFTDHWGHVRPEFDTWVKRTRRETFDPSLWFLAMDGEEIAGFSLCGVTTEIPWVETLGVRRPWRQRGLGLALLLHSFRELWARGHRKVALGVDSQNLTGATRLYEKAGMRADRDWVRYEKELRPGREIATVSL